MFVLLLLVLACVKAFTTIRSRANTFYIRQHEEEIEPLYCLNVNLYVKESKREEFLECIKQNQIGTLTTETRALLYTWGESITDRNTFHFQEQFVGEEGFQEHQSTAHFKEWLKFADESNDVWTKPPEVYVFKTM